MPLEYGTAVYDDILARNAALSSVSILTTLDADTIIAYIESRIDDKCILAALQVKTITILSVRRVANQYIFYKNVLAHQRMNVPCRRVLEDDTIEPNVLTAYETYHYRTEETLDLVPFFF